MILEIGGVREGPKCNFWVLNCKFFRTRLYIFSRYCLLIFFYTTKNNTHVYTRGGTKRYIFRV